MAARSIRMRNDVGHAIASRAFGLRRVRRLTWSIAGAGAVGAVVLAFGFGFGFGSHAHQASGPGGNQGTSNQGAGNQGAARNQQGGGQLQPPQEIPLPAQGPGQVVSGGS